MSRDSLLLLMVIFEQGRGLRKPGEWHEFILNKQSILWMARSAQEERLSRVGSRRENEVAFLTRIRSLYKQ